MSEEQATGQSEKREKFLRVAPGRVDKAVNAIRLLSQCANLDSYEYTRDQADEIESTLVVEMEKLVERFRDYRGATKFRF